MNKKQEKLLTHEEVKEILEQYEQETNSTQIKTMKYVVQTIISKPYAPVKFKEKLLSFGITEFEAVQLLNSPPKKILDLYVIVEELEERLTDENIAEILSLLCPYTE